MGGCRSPFGRPTYCRGGRLDTSSLAGGGPQLVSGDVLLDLGCIYAGLPQTNSSIRNAIGANMAIRRKVFELVGGFAEGIGRLNLIPLGCEETEIAIRYTAAGPDERFVMNREAVVHQVIPASRLTWHYFWSRCWSEGLSQGAARYLVGFDSGLCRAPPLGPRYTDGVRTDLPSYFCSTARCDFSSGAPTRGNDVRSIRLRMGQNPCSSDANWFFTSRNLDDLTSAMQIEERQIVIDYREVGHCGFT